MQSKVVVAQLRRAPRRPSPPPTISHVRRSPSSCRMLSRWRASSSTTSTRRSAWVSFASSRRNASTSSLALDRLQRVADRAALQRLLAVVGDRDHVHGMCRVARVVLQLVEHGQARVVRAGSCRARWRSGGRPRAAARPSLGRVRRPRTGSPARAPGRAGCARTRRRPRRPGCARAPGGQALAVVVDAAAGAAARAGGRRGAARRRRALRASAPRAAGAAAPAARPRRTRPAA